MWLVASVALVGLLFACKRLSVSLGWLWAGRNADGAGPSCLCIRVSCCLDLGRLRFYRTAVRSDAWSAVLDTCKSSIAGRSPGSPQGSRSVMPISSLSTHPREGRWAHRTARALWVVFAVMPAGGDAAWTISIVGTNSSGVPQVRIMPDCQQGIWYRLTPPVLHNYAGPATHPAMFHYRATFRNTVSRRVLLYEAMMTHFMEQFPTVMECPFCGERMATGIGRHIAASGNSHHDRMHVVVKELGGWTQSVAELARNPRVWASCVVSVSDGDPTNHARYAVSVRMNALTFEIFLAFGPMAGGLANPQCHDPATFRTHAGVEALWFTVESTFSLPSWGSMLATQGPGITFMITHDPAATQPPVFVPPPPRTPIRPIAVEPVFNGVAGGARVSRASGSALGGGPAHARHSNPDPPRATHGGSSGSAHPNPPLSAPATDSNPQASHQLLELEELICAAEDRHHGVLEAITVQAVLLEGQTVRSEAAAERCAELDAQAQSAEARSHQACALVDARAQELTDSWNDWFNYQGELANGVLREQRDEQEQLTEVQSELRQAREEHSSLAHASPPESTDEVACEAQSSLLAAVQEAITASQAVHAEETHALSNLESRLATVQHEVLRATTEYAAATLGLQDLEDRCRDAAELRQELDRSWREMNDDASQEQLRLQALCVQAEDRLDELEAAATSWQAPRWWGGDDWHHQQHWWDRS